jgi:5-oxoprolinase (ATP-hydrolysing) subunit C
MTLVVVRALGLVTVQDLGRPGRMHEAIPPGGALVPELLVAANRHARNADGAAAIEVLGRLVVRAEAELAVATAESALLTFAPPFGGAARSGKAGPCEVLAPGDELVIESEPRRVAYLAVRGGVDAPLVLGGHGALLAAGLGSPLRAGDRIAPARAPVTDAIAEPLIDADRIRVIAGPDLAAFAPDALERLAAAPYRLLAASDRVGTRLDGAALPRVAGYRETSRPMVRGAIEVPGDGLPIVLGPEHPTTGGYPVVAVIASADLGRFFAIRLGGSVHFECARTT